MSRERQNGGGDNSDGMAVYHRTREFPDAGLINHMFFDSVAKPGSFYNTWGNMHAQEIQCRAQF